MTWKRESYRHSLASQGVATFQASYVRTKPTKQFLGKKYEWKKLNAVEGFNLAQSYPVPPTSPFEIMAAWKLHPTENIIIVIKRPYSDVDTPHVRTVYLTLIGKKDKLRIFNEDYRYSDAEKVVQMAKWRTECNIQEGLV